MSDFFSVFFIRIYGWSSSKHPSRQAIRVSSGQLSTILYICIFKIGSFVFLLFCSIFVWFLWFFVIIHILSETNHVSITNHLQSIWKLWIVFRIFSESSAWTYEASNMNSKSFFSSKRVFESWMVTSSPTNRPTTRRRWYFIFLFFIGN